MSIGGPAFSSPPPVSGTAPDSPAYVSCPGCTSLSMQISYNDVFIQFGRGPAGGEFFDAFPEPYGPVVGSIFPNGGFDAFRWWAQTPAAKIPSNQQQAYAVLIPRT